MSKVAYITDEPRNDVMQALVREAVADLGATFVSPDAPNSTATIESIKGVLGNADAVIAFLAEGKRNVIYEIGAAHGLGKPVLLLAVDKSLLPFDLRSRQIIRIPDTQELTESDRTNIQFALQSQLKQALEDTQFTDVDDERNTLDQLRREDTTTAPFPFHEIVQAVGPEQAQMFEEWFGTLARGVPGWKVVSHLSEEVDRGSANTVYDFAIWNNLDIPELAALGNPIVVELKSGDALQKEAIEQLGNLSKHQNLDGVVLATTAVIKDSTRRTAESIFREGGPIIALIDREGLAQVHRSSQLVLAIKQALHQFRST